MYQVTASQTEQNIKLISCVKHHRCLYDHSDQNYKNSVYVDKAWQSVSKEFGENIIDCKKKWRHLRSSLSRYLKSSKDLAKNKNNKLKPYYLLQHMDFLVPYTKTLELKTDGIVSKYETSDDNEGFPELKAEDTSAYDHEIIQEESQSMEDDEDIVYETYEIQEQIPSTTTSQNTKSQVTLVRSSHLANQHNSSVPQLQPIINTISSMSPASKQQNQTLQLSSSQLSHLTQQGQQQQQQSSSQAVSLQGQQSSVQNTIIPISDDQSSADLNFFLALLPDVRNMNQDQKRRLRIGTLKLIDEILGNTQ